ncbi:MAG TPA: hypothetical protein VFB50_05885 [Chloroflexota bacterium]|nr:hypothetical protein [Chloroflexota bacterium]
MTLVERNEQRRQDDLADWRESQLYALARRMIDLDRWATDCERAGDHDGADRIWQRRERVQWQRSELLRDTPEIRARERERQSSCRPSSPDA